MAPTARTPDSASAARTLVVPELLLSWQDVLRVVDPTREPTSARFRHLRAVGQLSSGVVVVRRSGKGVAGRSTYLSALWAWAVRLRRQHQVPDAERIEGAARRVEEQFASLLEGFLSSRSLDYLHEAPFFTDLAEATTKALATTPHALDSVAVSGRVADLDQQFWRVAGRSPSGNKTVVHLPAKLLENAGVASGDLVWVLSLVVGTTALVEVVRAESTWLPDAPQALRWALYERDSEDDDEVAAAARYEQGPAAGPDLLYVASVLHAARVGDVPTRQLRLAG